MGKAKVYYQDKTKQRLRADLFSEEAYRDAQRLVKARVATTQVRRYFGEIRALQARYNVLKHEKGAEAAFEEIRPYLGLLKAKAYYGRRNNNNRPNDMFTLSTFLTECLDGVEDPKSFEAMVKYVEAVVAYFTPDAERRS
ncbi:type III-A CRISPR-associated protein Csm2 [Marinithermus hydrothermalis]|uniref:CRISPR system Cms protein Csm2 n=1 Tax=Marinithermus hydrothermalis (strain DSM 14884 / JCM 11576 / T1) TaxID=869210 RepID=F2NNA2_MARHT|nr:type III-A CRISPR-associated protein Csm2 [Marinithermus hydrothermalis]AEB10943.1 CRISPR-associated protein TM1810 domain protein [Marinithermus hydrothermalis DSM 14884]